MPERMQSGIHYLLWVNEQNWSLASKIFSALEPTGAAVINFNAVITINMLLFMV